MARVDHDIAVGAARGHPPAARLLVLRQLLEAVPHQHMIAARDDLVTRRLPHHAGAEPRITKCFEQSLGRHKSEEHTSELQSLMRISYAVFCLKKKKQIHKCTINHNHRQLKKTT